MTTHPGSRLIILVVLLLVNRSTFAFLPQRIERMALLQKLEGSKMNGDENGFDVVTESHSANGAATLHQPLRDEEDAASVTTVVYGIRHGTSVSNEWMTGDNEWGAPTFNDSFNVRDAPLSAAGVAQATALSTQLVDAAWIDQIELIVVSPLTRCLQTYQHAVHPMVANLNSSRPRPIPVLVHPLLAERVYCVSEMGRSVAQLQYEFPSLVDWSDWSPDYDPCDWWYNGAASESMDPSDDVVEEWRPYGQGQVYCAAGEPKTVFTQRMEALREWLRQRPERHILTVSHWGVYKHFTGAELSNCEVCTMEL